MRYGRRKLKKSAAILIVLWFLVLIPTAIVRSQEKPVAVAIGVMAPCVMQSDGGYKGFEIELWEEIAEDLGLEFAYYETTMDRIFKDLTVGKGQVGFSCITITDERETLVDFSHHTLDSGLRILVANKKSFSLVDSVKSLFSPLVMKAMASLNNITDFYFPREVSSANRSIGRDQYGSGPGFRPAGPAARRENQVCDISAAAGRKRPV